MDEMTFSCIIICYVCIKKSILYIAIYLYNYIFIYKYKITNTNGNMHIDDWLENIKKICEEDFIKNEQKDVIL